MAIYLQDIVDINLNGGMIHRNFKSVAIGSGDQNANRFGMRVFRDGVPEDLTGVSCQAVFQDPMGNNIALTSHGTVSGNMAYVTLPQACYNYEGNFCLAIKLIGGGVTGTMRIVDGVVNNTHTGGAVAPTGAVPTYQEVLAAYDDAIAAVDDVNELKSAFNQRIANDYEELNIGTPTAGKGISLSTGSMITTSTWDTSAYIPVIGGSKIMYTCPEASASATLSAIASAAFFTTNAVSGFISPAVALENGTLGNIRWKTITVPQNAKYMRMSIKAGQESNYKVYRVKEKELHTIIVGADNDCDYSSLKEAISAAVQYENSIVYVRSGEYDLVTEFGGVEYIEENSSTPIGIVLYNGVRVIFATGAKVICEYTGSVQNVFTNFSPFMSSQNVSIANKSFVIENLVLEAKGTRYAIHDECSLAGEYEHQYINCRIKYDQGNNPSYHRCIGGGLGAHGKIVIRGCTFETVATTNVHDVSYHNGAGEDCSSMIDISGCYFSKDLIAYNYGESTTKTPVFVHGCIMQNEPKIIDDTSSGVPEENMVIIAYNNTYRQSENPVTESTIMGIVEAEYGLTKFNATENYVILNATGSASSSTSWNVTSGYIPTNANKIAFTCPVLTNKSSVENVAAIAFYSDKIATSYLSYEPAEYGDAISQKMKVIDVPEGAKYFRASIYKSLASNYKIIEIGAENAKGHTSNEIVNLPNDGDTSVSTTIVNIDPIAFYTVKTYRMFGHELKAYASYDNGTTWTPVNLVNIHTGKESLAEYQHGEYLIIGTYGATKLKFVATRSDTNSLTLNLVKYSSVPFIRQANRNTEYLPGIGSVSEINETRCFGIYNGYAYAYYEKNIKRANLQTGTVENFYTHTYDIGSAMIFDNGYILFTEAEGTHNKMYLLADGTATEKHDFYDSTNSVRKTPNRLFSYHCDGAKAIVCEYYGSKTPTSGYKAFITEDYGVTWSEFFDLTDLIDDPVTNGVHLHSVVYDKYGDMYWACNGDDKAFDMIWYSLDGTNWYPAQQPYICGKPTEIVPMRDCVLFLSDSRYVSAFKWQRHPINAGDTIGFDTVKTFVHYWADACPIGAHAYYDEKNNVTYFGFYVGNEEAQGHEGNYLKRSEMFVTDGYNVKQVFVDDDTESLIGVYGDEDHVVISRLTNTILIHK